MRHSMLMCVLPMLRAVLVAVRSLGIVQGIVGMVRAMRVLVRMGMFVRVGVAVRMRMDHIAVPVFMGMNMGVGVFVTMLVRMAMGFVVWVTVIGAVHGISPSNRSR